MSVLIADLSPEEQEEFEKLDDAYMEYLHSGGQRDSVEVFAAMNCNNPRVIERFLESCIVDVMLCRYSDERRGSDNPEETMRPYLQQLPNDRTRACFIELAGMDALLDLASEIRKQK